MDRDVIRNNAEWIDKTWERLDKKLSKIAVKSRDKLPYTSINGTHDDMKDSDINWWTNGFWGGLMWLMYLGTKNEEYRITAERSEELMDGAFANYKLLHHDVGFMWHILSGASYRITGNEKSCTRNLYAASTLASRFNIDGGYIRAWNDEKNVNIGWSIIDCLMNLPLLYWASDEIKEPRFKKIAMAHADMALRDHICPDGSTHHVVEHNSETGEVIRNRFGQGYSDDSCWSRGLSWAVYGMIVSYVHTGKAEYLDGAKRTANYFIVNSSATGYKTVVDFKAPKEPVYYDSTAGVIAACGMLELSKYVSEAESKAYTEAAINILKATDEHFCNYSDEEDAVVLMGTERYPVEEGMGGVHMPIIYGDFFYAEALLKLKGNDFLIW